MWCCGLNLFINLYTLYSITIFKCLYSAESFMITAFIALTLQLEFRVLCVSFESIFLSAPISAYTDKRFPSMSRYLCGRPMTPRLSRCLKQSTDFNVLVFGVFRIITQTFRVCILAFIFFYSIHSFLFHNILKNMLKHNAKLLYIYRPSVCGRHHKFYSLIF